MTFVPSRRQHARFICKLSMKIAGSGMKTPMEGTMLNVGMGGAYIVAKGSLKVATATLRIELGMETLSVEARIVRSAGPDPKDSQSTYYGIEFARDGQTQGRLRLLVDRVRSGPSSSPPDKLAGYWK